MRPVRQRGAASAEYVWATLVIVSVLFLPLGDGRSIVEILLDALRGFQATSIYLLSMP